MRSFLRKLRYLAILPIMVQMIGCEFSLSGQNSAAYKIRRSSIGGKSKYFASDFSKLYEILSSHSYKFPTDVEKIANHLYCAYIGAMAYPKMKIEIDQILATHPIDGVILKYGEGPVLPGADLNRLQLRVLAGIGMSATAGPQYVICDGQKVSYFEIFPK